MNDEKSAFEEVEVIHSYTRQQAIEDGVLVDITPIAEEAGLKFPVALTRGVYESYVAVPPGVRGQDVEGRLWDLLWLLNLAIRCQRPQGPVLHYELLVRNDNRKARKVELKAVCGPADDGSPCLTVMHPWED
jgi:hypothetical protein